MGICWSDIPPPSGATYQACLNCRKWENTLRMKDQCCEECIRKINALSQNPTYTYAKPQQQQYYVPQPQQYYVPQPQAQYYVQQQTQPQYYPQQYYPQQPQQRQQIGTGTAVAGGFVLGAMLDTMLDPSD